MKISNILIVAIFSRVTLISIAIFSNLLVSDHSPFDVEFYSNFESCSEPFLTFTKWDSAHFLNIAKMGRRSHQFVFYPAYPFVINLLSSWLSNIFVWEDCVYDIVSGILVSNISFVVSAISFSVLLSSMKFSEDISSKALICYCFNPASVFFSTVYSESLFLLLSCLSLQSLITRRYHLSSVLLFLLSTVRSNGTFIVVFILCFLGFDTQTKLLNRVLLIGLLSVCSIFPTLLWDLYSRDYLCHHTEVNFHDFPLDVCDRSYFVPSRSVYSALQEKYWNVGFLRQFKLRQFPNFCLALPVQLVIYHGNILYWRDASVFVKSLMAHSIFCVVVCLLWAHVQISTRLLFSSNPIVYIFCAHFTFNASKWIQYLMVIYFTLYFTVGTVLHVNFYPWT